LAAALGLNRSTVASLIAELVARGLILERARSADQPQGRGRPSPVVELRRDGPGALAVEISTDWIGAAVIGLGGVVFRSVRCERSLVGSHPDQVLDQLQELVEPLLTRSIDEPYIVAMGISVPGVVRAEDGLVHHAPNLGWHEVPLGAMVRARFPDLGVPVFVRNDADLAASAEHLRGSGRGSNDFICLWGEGGIGAGFVVGGRSLTGSAGYAGEVGHVTVDPRGDFCACGARGCWEVAVAEQTLLRRSGRDPLGGSDALADLLSAADEGDQLALSALAESGRWLGIGLAGLVNVFNPSRVSLGGLYSRIYPYVKDAVIDELQFRVMPAARAMVELTTVQLGADALLLGAAELALAPLLYDPAILPTSDGSETAAIRRNASPGFERWRRPSRPA
jgi:predicted NBD/HSP70 family sugar kinase